MTATSVFQVGLFQGATVSSSDTKLASFMDGLDTLVSAIVERHYAYPVESISVPCALVAYPTTIDFDTVFGRGADRFVIPVWFVAGKTATVDARDRISEILSEAGTIKSAVDGSHTFGDFDVTVRAMTAEISEFTNNGISYIGCRFDCEVYG
jgi:hypothetical protein